VAEGTALGVDVGGTKLLAVRLNPDGSVTTEITQHSPKDGPSLVAAIRDTVDRYCDGSVPAIGVGVPGLVDVSGTVKFAPNLHGLSDHQLKWALQAEFPDAALWVGNDATAACWAERTCGAAVGSDEILMVTLGTGIGGGVVSGGRLHEGAHRYAGEFGHMVVDPNGPLCPCGKKGCWERFASGSGLGVLARESALAGTAVRLVELAGGDPEAVRGEHVTSAAAEGDRSAQEIMDRFARWVALGLSNLANILDPELIVIGGGLITAGDVLMEPTRRAFEELVEAPAARSRLRILPAALGASAGAIGAALRAAAGVNAGGSGVPVQ
jgi:glucokinase